MATQPPIVSVRLFADPRPPCGRPGYGGGLRSDCVQGQSSSSQAVVWGTGQVLNHLPFCQGASGPSREGGLLSCLSSVTDGVPHFQMAERPRA